MIIDPEYSQYHKQYETNICIKVIIIIISFYFYYNNMIIEKYYNYLPTYRMSTIYVQEFFDFHYVIIISIGILCVRILFKILMYVIIMRITDKIQNRGHGIIQ